MLFKSKKRTVGAFAIFSILLLSFSSQHPAGNSGAPGDGLCSNCHSGGGGVDGTVEISGLPSVVDPSTTYNVTLTLTITSGTPARAAFQVVALDQNDNNAGDWTNPGSNSSLIVSGGREYFGHNPWINFSGGSASWDAEWAPPNINDDVTFYMVGNFANGNGGTSGDRIITSTETITVQGTTPVEVDIDMVEGVSCFDGDDGSATATASGGSPPYNYQWSSGESNAIANNLSGGNQSVTVTDNDGTTAVANVNIPEPDEIAIDPEITDVSCFGEDDGIVSINPFGGTGNLDCDWSSVGLGCDQDGLDPGVYFVTITDENDCSIVEEIEVNEPNPIELNLSFTDESNSGANDGTATSEPNGGTAPYNFNWSNGTNENGNGSTIDNLPAGQYFVTVTDQNNCEEEGSIMVLPGDCALEALADITNIACHGDSTGSIDLTIINGTPPYVFLWSNGDSTQNISNVPAANYSVEITDGVGCNVIVNDLEVEQPDSLIAHLISVSHASCPDGNDGEIILNVLGGVGNYDLSWSNGVSNDTTIMGMDTIINIPDTLSGLTPGLYTYTLFDGNNCSLIDSIMVLHTDTINPILVLDQGTVYLDENGQAPPATFDMVDAGSSDNCGIDSIEFTTPSYTCADIFSFNYPVTIYDAAGNSTSGMATVNVVDTIPPVIDCTTPGDIVTSTCDTINYTLPTATDNCAVAGIELVDGLPSGSVFPVGLTTVTYRAVDDCGYTAECSFTVTVNADLSQTLMVAEISCPGASDGVIGVTNDGGTPPYTTEITGGFFTDLGPGIYTVVTSDSGGCSVMETIELIDPPTEMYNLEVTEPTCFNGDDGSVNLDDLPDNVSWEFDGDPDNLSGDLYEVTITNAGSGCVVVQDFFVSQPGELGLENLVINDPTCYDSDDCSLDYEVVGGTGVVTVTIDEGDSCGDPVMITLTDEVGCEVSGSISYVVPDTLGIENVNIIPQSDVPGAIFQDPVGGVGPYSYIWTNELGDTISFLQNVDNLETGTYFLELIDANGCSEIFEFFVDFETSTIDLDKDNAYVSVSPNPAQREIRIEFKDLVPDRITIYSADAKLQSIITDIDQVINYNLEEMESGLYIMHLSYEDKIVIKRFIKL